VIFVEVEMNNFLKKKKLKIDEGCMKMKLGEEK